MGDSSRVPVEIRKFRLEDLNQILEIEKEAFPKTAYPKNLLLQFAGELPDTFIIVEKGKEIVAYMIFDQGGHIYSTAVRPEHRRKGFGRKMFAHALRQTEERLWLEVRSKNTVAIGFYKRLGMKVAGTIGNYYGDDDALVMVLDHRQTSTSIRRTGLSPPGGRQR